MSNEVNDLIIEQAQEMIDYWEGTVIADVLRRDLAVQDLENLSKHTKEAREQIDELDRRLESYGKEKADVKSNSNS